MLLHCVTSGTLKFCASLIFHMLHLNLYMLYSCMETHDYQKKKLKLQSFWVKVLIREPTTCMFRLECFFSFMSWYFVANFPLDCSSTITLPWTGMGQGSDQGCLKYHPRTHLVKLWRGKLENCSQNGQLNEVKPCCMNCTIKKMADFEM